MDLRSLIDSWEHFKNNKRNDVIFLTDKHFNEHFEMLNEEGYISAVFDVLNGKYGFERSVQYNTMHISPYPLLINHDTMEMSLLRNESCEDVIFLKTNCLTIISNSFIVTTSSYLKTIYVLLFLRYKHVEGINYVLNNMVHIVSSIIPYFIRLRRCSGEREVISIPFSIAFLENLPFKFNVDCFHSQIDDRTYKI